MNKLWTLLFLPLALMLGWVSLAEAGDITPVEGRDYWIMPSCDVGTCVKIAPDININTPLFAAQLKTTPIDIRRDNPLGTIALCHRPGDGYRMGNISKPADRADDSVWASCPNPADQYVYILPNQVIKLTGVKHLSFSEQQKILSATMACETQECLDENNRKLNSKVKRADKAPPAPIVPQPTPSATAPAAAPDGPVAGSVDAVVVEVPVVPDWCRWLIGSLGAIAVLFIVLYVRLRYFVMAKTIGELSRSFQEKSASASRSFQRLIRILKENARSQAELLESRADEIAVFNNVLDELRSGFVEFAKRESVPVPQETNTQEVWRLVSQHFAGVARENGELRNEKLLLEQSNVRLEQEKTEADSNFQRQVAVNSGLAQNLLDRNHELTEIKEDRERNRRNRERLAELHALLLPLDRELILVDNELTDLTEPHQSAFEEYKALESAGDPRAAEVKAEIESMEARILPLFERRQALNANADPWRVEFDSLFERLNGFALNAVPLYEEAQRDRNDAAREKGRANAVLTQAKALRDGAESHLRQREAEMRAEADANFKIREDQLQAKIDELVQRECDLHERESSIRPQGDSPIDLADYRSKIGVIRSQRDQARNELAELRTAHGNLANELSNARADSRRFESELEKLTLQLESVESAHRGCSAEIEGLTAKAAASVARALELQEELDSVLLNMAKTPSPVPAIFPVSAPQVLHRPTRPYEETRTGVRDATLGNDFFDVLTAVLSAREPIVVDTPQAVWKLYDFLKRFKVDIRLDALFPGGPGSNYPAMTWEKLCDKFRQSAVDKVVYVVEELALRPPQDYKPLALASGS